MMLGMDRCDISLGGEMEGGEQKLDSGSIKRKIVFAKVSQFLLSSLFYISF